MQEALDTHTTYMQMVNKCFKICVYLFIYLFDMTEDSE